MNTHSDTLQLAILGSGSGTNMQSIADAIQNQQLDAEIRVVLSDVADAGILERARKLDIPGLWLDCAPYKTKLDGNAELRCIDLLRKYQVDTVVLAGFMRMIKKSLLTAFPMRVINIHPALLPAFPGLAAWKQALEYGAKITGCTVHFVDAGMDTGPIIMQRSVPVLESDTPSTLHARIQLEERQALPAALHLLSERRLKVQGRQVNIIA